MHNQKSNWVESNGGGQWGDDVVNGGGMADQDPHSFATAVCVVNNGHCIVLGKLYLRVNMPSSF